MGNICSTTPDIETRLFQPASRGGEAALSYLPPPMEFLSSEPYYYYYSDGTPIASRESSS